MKTLQILRKRAFKNVHLCRCVQCWRPSGWHIRLPAWSRWPFIEKNDDPVG